MSVAALANTACRVVRLGAPSGASGARSESIVWSGVARIQPLSASARAGLGRDLETVTTKAYIDGTTPIAEGDRLYAKGDLYHVRGEIDVDLLGRLTTLYLERKR